MPHMTRLPIPAAATVSLLLIVLCAARALGFDPGAPSAAARATADAAPLPHARPAAADAELARLVGYYEAGASHRLWIRLREARLSVQVGASPWMTLLPLSPNRFIVEDAALEIEFDARPAQRANALALRDAATTTVLLRAHDASAPLANVPFYLRGSMNQWATTQRMLDTGARQYSATMMLRAGLHEFKLGSADWHAIDLGGASDAATVTPGQRQELQAVGANLKLQIERAGNYRFTLDVGNPQAPVVVVTEAP
jgi:hypothetical protein